MQLGASCLCGANRFRAKPSAKAAIACHCSQCRKTSGHYAASFDALAPLDWQARGAVAEYETPGGARRGFCTICGSSLYFIATDGAVSIEAGAVDGPTGLRLAAHIHTADAGDYYGLDDGLPRHEGAGDA